MTYTLARGIAHFAPILRLVQAPNHRSSHLAPTPTGGGLAFVIVTVLTAVWLAVQSGGSAWFWLFLPAVFLAVLGAVDDIRPVSARLRFGLHCLAVLWLVGADTSPAEGVPLNAWSGLIFMVAGVWWINLFNFMDGIDGIATAEALFILIGLLGLAGAMGVLLASASFFLVYLALLGALVGFLAANWSPARIFMGDAGSTFLAFVILGIAALLIRLGFVSLAQVVILGAVFAVDATVTLVARCLRGEAWWAAHRSHLYQQLARTWSPPRERGHRRVVILMTLINLLWLWPMAWAAGTVKTLPDPVAWVVLAYAPLVWLAVRSGAGRADT